jgi:hypothetical protein
MLTRVGHLLHKGYRPEVVFIAITWRNVARDSLPRDCIYRMYADRQFCAAFEQMLSGPQVNAAPEVLGEVAAQRRRIEHDEEQERLKSDADRIDEALTDWTRGRLNLMLHSVNLRAYLFRTMTDRIQDAWRGRTTVKYTYDLMDHDYAFNRQCLRALLRLLRAQGATVVCYYAPERDDLPLLMDPQRQNEFMAAFNREAAELGVIVLDARAVVPSEYWGWEGNTPDRSHFIEPGHQRLAQFLCDEAARHAVWQELSRP